HDRRQHAHASNALGALASRRGTVRGELAADRFLAVEPAPRTAAGQQRGERDEQRLRATQVHTPYPLTSVSPHSIPGGQPATPSNVQISAQRRPASAPITHHWPGPHPLRPLPHTPPTQPLRARRPAPPYVR